MKSEESFASLGRVEAIRSLFEGTRYAPFAEPLWTEAPKGSVVTTSSKVFTEGVDFNLEYFPLKHLGYRCVVGVVGELYAVMSRPETLGVTLCVSAKLDYDQIKELWEGVVHGAEEFGFKGLSLELQPSRNGLVISMGATGLTPAAQTVRPKAESKDLVCVSGSLGAAYLGMQVLEKRKDLQKYRMLVSSYLRPEIPGGVPEQMEKSSIFPSYGYFVTKGLADALLRLGRDSGFGVKAYASKMPFEGGSFDAGRELDIDPVSAAMNGGEDFRLLFVIPIARYEDFRRDFQTFDIIGHLALPEAGVVMVTPDGVELPVSSQGWCSQNL